MNSASEVLRWIPSLPDGWDVVRAKFVMREVDERSEDGLELLLSLSKEHGVVPRSHFGEASGRADSLVGYKRVQAGQIVSNKMQAWNGLFGLARTGGIVSPDYAVYQVLAGAEARFVVEQLRTPLYAQQFLWRSRGMGTAFLRLHPEALLDTPLLVPSERFQRGIADFLDTETARIDALIAKKQRLRDAVEERWQQFVRRTLLSLDAPTLPLKRRWQVLDCKHRTPTYTDSGYPVVSPGDATPGRLDLMRCTRFVGESDFRDLIAGGRQPVRGTIIYSRNASIGIACYVDTDEELTMGQDVCLIKSPDQDQLYLAYALNSLGVDQLAEQKIGSTFSRVNVSQIVELEIPVPPPAIQREIARRFDDERERVDRLASKLEKQVRLLREHRQALITAAVTGELEVPGVAA